MEIADVIQEIKVSCQYCNEKAQFNMKLSPEGRRILEGAQIEIGDGRYKSVCWSHFDIEGDKV